MCALCWHEAGTVDSEHSYLGCFSILTLWGRQGRLKKKTDFL